MISSLGVSGKVHALIAGLRLKLSKPSQVLALYRTTHV
jgi:hypothetical protein